MLKTVASSVLVAVAALATPTPASALPTYGDPFTCRRVSINHSTVQRYSIDICP